jgi:putative membrane protein
VAQELKRTAYQQLKTFIMKRLSNFCMVAVMSLFIASCGSGGSDATKDAKDSNANKMDSSGTDSGAAKTSAIPASVSKDDATFVVNAADAGMTEVQLGQLAQQKGTRKDVKDYGAMMEKDHTAAGDKLKALATQKNITLPTSISPEMQKNVDDLQKKSGKDFDKAYISMMVDDHKKVISAFEDESKKGSDADIRSFADSTLHTLRHHLQEAEKCKKMEKGM